MRCTGAPCCGAHSKNMRANQSQIFEIVTVSSGRYCGRANFGRPAISGWADSGRPEREPINMKFSRFGARP